MLNRLLTNRERYILVTQFEGGICSILVLARAQLRCKIAARMIFFFGGIMKRVPAFILLIALSLACSISARAQIFMGKDSARQSQNAVKKQQKALKKAAKKQRKAMKKYEKAQRKAAKRAQRRA